MKKPNDSSRRAFLQKGLAAAGTLGLRSMLLGLPPAFITSRAMAATKSTYLIYSCNGQGCPVNPNVPGSYLAGVTHPGSFATPASFTLGGKTVQGAAPWGNLPQALRDRLQFIHHDTQTNAHSEAENVLKVQGALKATTGSGSEMLPSAIAQLNQATLGTMQASPILMGAINSNLTFNSVPQPLIAPGSLTSLFPAAAGTATSLLNFRDRAIDSLYRDLKSNGTSAQKKFLDDHALSSKQARSMASEFQNTLSGLGVSGLQDQMVGAAALIAAKVTPTIVVSLRFGSDNHSQSGAEEPATIESAAALAFLWDRLNALGVADQTTFFLQNVFGRTLHGSSAGGRSHHGAHTVGVMFGPNVKGGVTGELQMSGTVGRSSAINSTTGLAAGADIPTNETLASTAKTLMKACGIDETEINRRVTLGKVLRSAVA